MIVTPPPQKKTKNYTLILCSFFRLVIVFICVQVFWYVFVYDKMFSV